MRAPTLPHWPQRAVALLAATLVMTTLPLLATPVAARADTGATCSARSDASVCATYSDLLLSLMDTVAPGSVTAFSAELARGYRLDPTTTETCVLHVTCDAWPVAIDAATTLNGAGACALADPAICAAIDVATSEQHTEAVSSTLANIVAALAPVPVADRVPQLSIEVNRVLPTLANESDGQAIADSLVGVIALALMLPPAQSPGAGADPQTQTNGVEVIESGDGTAISSSDLTDSIPSLTSTTSSPTTLGSNVQRCRASYELFNSLETWDGSSFTTFQIWANAGIENLRWLDLNELHTRCPVLQVAFTGSIFAEAYSNAKSFIETHTKRSSLVQGSEILYMSNLSNKKYVADVGVVWETDKVNLSYYFPFGFAIDNYAPPVGDYSATATGRAQLSASYKYSTKKTVSVETYDYSCDKQGSSPSDCTTTVD